MKIAILFFTLILNVLYQAPRKDKVQYLPDQKLTPGDSLAVSKDDLCEAGFKSSADDLTIAVKRQIFDRYAMSPTDVGYNVDHLIPVGLGGSDSVKNLWPQPLSGEWNYNMKNRLEKRLRKMVCSGELKLEEAQREIAGDWVSTYRKYILEQKRSSRH
jgi:hypothetical protein